MIKRAAVLCGAVFVYVLLAQTNFFKHQAEQCMDICFSLRGERTTSQEIVIVAVDEHSIEELGGWPFPRDCHAQLFERLRQAKVIGYDLIFSVDLAGMELLTRNGKSAVFAVTSDFSGRLIGPNLSNNRWLCPGHIETKLGTDGTLRQVSLFQRGIPSFALALYEECASKMRPTPEDGATYYINFYGPEFTFLYLSYSDVLAGNYPPEFFANRYVLVGAKAKGLGDVHMMPFSRLYPVPGVEIQATILNNLLDRTLLENLDIYNKLFSFILLLVFVFIWPYNSAAKNCLLNFFYCVVLCSFSYLLFINDLYFDPFIPIFTLLVGFLFHNAIVWGTVTTNVLQEISSLNLRLDEGIQTFFTTVPDPLEMLDCTKKKHKQSSFGGLDRYINRLHRGIRALTIQNSFVQHLLSTEAPPLICWMRNTGEVMIANSRFVRLWHSLNPQSKTLPNLSEFYKLLEESCAEEGGSKIGRRVEQEAQKNEQMQQENIIDIIFSEGGQRTYLRVVCHDVNYNVMGVQGVMASFTDITEIKELERLKSDVINIVSHELKLPLTTIMGFGEMIADVTKPSDPVRGYAQEISKQSQRLAKMIEDFLDIARIENGKYVVNRLPFSLLDVIYAALIAAGGIADKKAIELQSELPQKVTPLIGDESLMTQVIINLLDNAIKFSEEKSLVVLRLLEMKDSFEITVTDQGEGVRDDEKLKIFEKFARGAKEVRGTGFGLGLNFVQQVVQGHDGTIWVENGEVDGEKCGAVFHIRLPKRGTKGVKSGDF